jgi:pimeloyl-ACP methyl ester carboxylesterase
MIATRRFLTKFRSAAAVMLAGDPDRYLKIPAGPSYDGFASCFANFVPGPEAAVLGAAQGPLALGAFTTPSGPVAWTTIPSWAVIGRADRAIPPTALTTMAQRAHAKITYVQAGHLSMITKPQAVATVIEQAARPASFPAARPARSTHRTSRSTHRTKGDRTTCR